MCVPRVPARCSGQAGDRHDGCGPAAALQTAVKAARRGGTVSVRGVYGGEADPMPLMEMCDRGIAMRMGQCHVKRWIDDLLPMVNDSADPLDLASLATHRVTLDQAPAA